jgi:primase-polymerase (primpol)-like protein
VADHAARTGRFDGIGFVVNGDGIVGGDLDGCRLPHSGEIHPTAREIINRMHTYTEVSPSGCGFRLFGLAVLPADHPCRVGSIEVYSRARYFTVTGKHLSGTPTGLTEISDGLHW